MRTYTRCILAFIRSTHMYTHIHTQLYAQRVSCAHSLVDRVHVRSRTQKSFNSLQSMSKMCLRMYLCALSTAPHARNAFSTSLTYSMRRQYISSVCMYVCMPEFTYVCNHTRTCMNVCKFACIHVDNRLWRTNAI